MRRTVTFTDGHLAGTRIDTEVHVIQSIDYRDDGTWAAVTYDVDPRTNTASVRRPPQPRTRWQRLRDLLRRHP